MITPESDARAISDLQRLLLSYDLMKFNDNTQSGAWGDETQAAIEAMYAHLGWDHAADAQFVTSAALAAASGAFARPCPFCAGGADSHAGGGGSHAGGGGSHAGGGGSHAGGGGSHAGGGGSHAGGGGSHAGGGGSHAGGGGSHAGGGGSHAGGGGSHAG